MPTDTIREVYFAARDERAKFNGLPLFRVPVENLPNLEAKIEKINKKADKLGTEPVVLSTVGQDEKQHRSEITGEITHVTNFSFVTIDGTTPKLNGWALAAAIDHLSGEGNLIRTVPGVEVNTTPYREANADCDHCGWNRRRKSTYIVKHDDGTVKQVGSNCLGDFTGANNPEKAARWAEYLMDIMDAASASESSGGGGVQVIMLSSWLANVCASIRQSGWCSVSRAWDTDECSTKEDAMNRITNRKLPKDMVPTDEDRDEAEAAIEWVRENVCTIPVDDRDDFQHNMAVVFSRDYVEHRGMGISAYAPVARKRAIEQEIREKARASAKANSEFVGQEKKRGTFILTVARVVEIENRYAQGGADLTKPLYDMVDENGNAVKWFASTWKAGMEQGKTYQIVGTVKRHENDPRFGKATHITRCKVISEKG